VRAVQTVLKTSVFLRIIIKYKKMLLHYKACLLKYSTQKLKKY